MKKNEFINYAKSLIKDVFPSNTNSPHVKSEKEKDCSTILVTSENENIPEDLTADSEEFVQEIIVDKYSSPLKQEPIELGQWEPRSIRCGLICKKIGIYPMWRKDGRRFLATLLQASDNHVIKYIPPDCIKEKTLDKKRFANPNLAGLIVGADSADPRYFTKEYFNMFNDSGVMPKKILTKFIITQNARLQPGTPLFASHFKPGDYVDVRGVTINRGFQGVMKRWGFKGGPASHGSTKFHRKGGAIGTAGAGRVMPGKKMPGDMGREIRTLRGVKVWRINTKYNVLWVHGPAIPGETGNYVYLYDTVLPTRLTDQHPNFPTFFQEEHNIEEELFDFDLHDFRDASITFTVAK